MKILVSLFLCMLIAASYASAETLRSDKNRMGWTDCLTRREGFIPRDTYSYYFHNGALVRWGATQGNYEFETIKEMSISGEAVVLVRSYSPGVAPDCEPVYIKKADLTYY